MDCNVFVDCVKIKLHYVLAMYEENNSEKPKDELAISREHFLTIRFAYFYTKNKNKQIHNGRSWTVCYLVQLDLVMIT